jgi:hypothetical protein
MRKTLLLTGACSLLSACYFVHQEKFEQLVHSWIRIDMPFSLAISILGTKGMTCTGNTLPAVLVCGKASNQVVGGSNPSGRALKFLSDQ